MPFKSKAQSRLMHAVANDKSGEVADATGVDPAAAKRFIAHAGGKSQFNLPERKRKKPNPEAAEEKAEGKADNPTEERSERKRPASSPFSLPKGRKHG